MLDEAPSVKLFTEYVQQYRRVTSQLPQNDLRICSQNNISPGAHKHETSSDIMLC